MKKIGFLSLFLFVSIVLFAQKETFDITSYTAPNGWNKEEKKNVVSYKIINQQKKTWSQIGIYRSMTTKGSAAKDFEREWQELIVNTYKITDAPKMTDIPEQGGWQIKSGGSKYIFNKQNAMVMLTTYSGYGKTVSIVALASSPDYGADIQNLLASVELSGQEGGVGLTNTDSNTGSQTYPVNRGTNSARFAFSTSNFDDGWMAAEKTDWVELRNGTITVLLHYTNAVTGKYIPNRDEATTVAWNNLIAPKYSNLKNYFMFNNTLDPEAPFLVSGDVVENSTGKNVHVVLFNRGKSGMIEFICADRSTFIKQFGIDQTKLNFYSSFESWEPLKRMASYNKFAVAASDFYGKWTTDFSSIQQYVNMYTGMSAGMSSYSSKQVFDFSGSNYKWSISTASGMGGNLKFKGSKSNGAFSLLSNWQLNFSDIDGKPKIYDAYFSCIKGARVLWLSDTGYPGYTSFGKAD
ncbi:MAG: hypothetical protein ACOYLO_14705 [Ferruginibacter sp.]